MPRAVRASGSGAALRFTLPNPGVGAIRRDRASRAVAAAVDASPVSAITAPSGYGKTTAVADWARASPFPVAWLTLGPLDASPRRLTQSVILALIGADPAVELDPDTEDAAIAYAAIFDAYPGPQERVLVIDDAHRAGEAWADGILGELVAQPPDGLRIVLVGNALLEATLSRLALSEPRAIVRAEELAFDESELATLVSLHGASLTPKAILDETRGWPIAARLLLLGGASGETVREASLLRDYVRDQVLSSLPSSLAGFILDSSVCADVTPSLAQAVTGVDDAERMLEECVRRGLFLDRYETARGVVYRWHAVFARQCVMIRHAADPVYTRLLHLRAAQFLASRDPLDAIRHALLADEVDEARRIMLERWVGLIVGPSAGAVDAACVELMQRRGEDVCLLLIRACAADVTSQHRVARELFARAENGIDDDDPQREETITLNLARLFVSDERAAAAAASAEVRAMLAAGEGRGLADRAAISYLIGWTEIRHRTNSALPMEYFAAAAREAQASGDRGLARRSLGHLAFALTWAGRLSRAASILEELEADAPESAPWSYYAGGSAVAASGYLAYWRREPARAMDEFARVISAGSSSTSFAGVSRMMFAYAAAESGDVGMCRRAAMAVQEIPLVEVHGVSWPAFRESSVALLEEAAGDRDRALVIARRYLGTDNLPVVCVALAGVLRRGGDLPAALQLLRGLRSFADVSYVRVATLVTAAALRRASGDIEAAHDLCESALEIASAEDLRLPFGPRETQVQRLLRDHIPHGTRFEGFIASCLSSSARSVREVLTERELSVYHQFQTTRTLVEIADELGLSVNTVKTHQRSIYRKLGVSTRREAVRAAL